MKRCAFCKNVEITGRRRLYCGVTCKMKAYWRRKYQGRMGLDELVKTMNWYLVNEPATLASQANMGEILVLLYGSKKRVKYEDGVFTLEDVNLK